MCHGTKYPSPQVMVHPEQFTLIPGLGSGYSADPGWSQDFSSPDEKDRGKSFLYSLLSNSHNSHFLSSIWTVALVSVDILR